MKLPDHVMILGRRYEICREKLDDEFGAIEYSTGVIFLDSSLEPHEVTGTLLHEILHGILHEAGLRTKIRTKTEEVLVTALENGLMRSGMIRTIDKPRTRKV